MTPLAYLIRETDKAIVPIFDPALLVALQAFCAHPFNEKGERCLGGRIVLSANLGHLEGAN